MELAAACFYGFARIWFSKASDCQRAPLLNQRYDLSKDGVPVAFRLESCPCLAR